MKNLLFVTLALLGLTLTINAQDRIFNKISDKTWIEDNGWAGTTLVFYKTSNGLLKAIKQINGSGVPAISSSIYDIEIKEDSVYLVNGLDLTTSDKVERYNYLYDSKTGLFSTNGKVIRVLQEMPNLYAWTKKKKVMTRIDINLLTNIPIEKSQIYKEEDVIRTLIDK